MASHFSLCSLVLSRFFSALVCILGSIAHAQTDSTPEERIAFSGIAINQITLSVDNAGQFAALEYPNRLNDPVTQEFVYKSVFPRGSDNIYFRWLQLMFGGLVDDDTLVTWGEFIPDPSFGANFRYRSRDVNYASLYDPQSAAQLEVSYAMVDTFPIKSLDPVERRPHLSLGLRVEVSFYSWSGAALDSFILVEISFENIGNHTIRNPVIGFWTDFSVRHVSRLNELYDSSVTHRVHMSDVILCADSSLEFVFGFDNDGDPYGGQFGDSSVPGTLGMAFLGGSRSRPQAAYNWFSAYSEGGITYWYTPREYPPPGSRLRQPPSAFNVVGFPEGDLWLYYTMTNDERDFNTLSAGHPFHESIWLPVPQPVESLSLAYKGSLLVYAQPLVGLAAGQKGHLTIALAGSNGLHVDPYNYRDRINIRNSSPYLAQLDFTGIAKNIRYADWVYDNPGYDSDGDGYRGEFRICDFDTVWYKGDGIPDFRADIPPPPPYVRIETENNRLRVQWNGYRTESATDLFTNEKDFEGYRVYLGRDERESSMSLVTSYDIANFNRSRFVTYANGEGRWEVTELPFSLDSLRLLFSDSLFDPLAYTRSNPLRVADSFFYFEKNDANNSDLSLPSGVRKAYPDAPRPNDDSSLWSAEEITYEHDSLRLPKFYEYEYTIDSINAAVPWYVAVTAFDFGFASGGLPPAESEIKETLASAYAQTSAQQVVANNLEAYVYPNPYRVDGGYSAGGYENRDNYLPEEKGRLLHFANLPHLCTIQIFSLDGDRIITLEHDREPNAPDAMHHTWDLITRNRQLITSGLYYYVIESPLRETQIGKFVVIK